MTVKKAVVLFDMDGVMIDSEIGGYHFIHSALKASGVDVPWEVLFQKIGRSTRTIVRDLIAEYNLKRDEEELLLSIRTYGNYYRDDESLKPMDGLLSFCKWLSEQQVTMGVVSSTSARSVLFALNRLGVLSFFSVVICGDMVENTKPSPEGYQTAMRMLDVSPEDCIIIEDSVLGIQAGKNAGACVIGFKGSEIEQDTSAADYEAKTFEECKEIVERCLRLT